MLTTDTLTAGVLSALLGLWGTYLLGLLTPGPNFLAIGGISALQGFRATLPLIMGIVAGSSLQVVCIGLVISVMPRGSSSEALGRLIGAALLITIAVRLWRSATQPSPPGLKKPAVAGVFAGLSIGFCNPVTFSGITAQMLGPAAVLVGSSWVLVVALGVAALGLVRSLIVARIFAVEAIRQAALAMRRPITAVIATILLFMGVVIALPLLESEPGIAGSLHP